jgi:hypothetical protein
VGFLIVGLGIYLAHWLYRLGIEHVRTEQIEKHNDLYATIQKIDVDARTKLGIEPAPSKITTVVDKTSIEGTYFSRSYGELKIEPWKMQQFAIGTWNGRPFHVREWTPMKEGKLFSDNEWDDLVKFLKQPVPTTPDLHYIVQRHPTNPRQGFDWTDAGTAWLEKLVPMEARLPR